VFLPFFETLRRAGVPVSLREYLAFLEGMAAGLATYDAEGFYFLARTVMVKDERHLDRFDRAFAESFRGLEHVTAQDVLEAVDLPAGWLARMAEKHLTAEEKAAIEALGGFDALMDTLKKRLEQQKGRHEGGSTWIGTAGTSPFGAYGCNPEGVRIGQDACANGRAAGRRTSLTLTAPSAPPPNRAGLTCSCAPNGATPSRCCCFWTQAARWTPMSG